MRPGIQVREGYRSLPVPPFLSTMGSVMSAVCVVGVALKKNPAISYMFALVFRFSISSFLLDFLYGFLGLRNLSTLYTHRNWVRRAGRCVSGGIWPSVRNGTTTTSLGLIFKTSLEVIV